jgi:hypothetical protein
MLATAAGAAEMGAEAARLMKEAQPGGRVFGGAALRNPSGRMVGR